jgi:hypothetical protein
VRHLVRFTLGSPYTEIFTRLRSVFAEPPLTDSLLAVDLTGVGKPILDMLRQAKFQARLRPMLITAGHKTSQDGGTWVMQGRSWTRSMRNYYRFA